MASNVSNFLTMMSNGGSRANRYRVTVPTIAGNIEFFCKATSLPASTIGKCEVPYAGRVVNFAGDRTFDDWNVTIYNENGHAERKKVITWMKAMNKHKENTGGVATSTYYDIGSSVEQLDRDGAQESVIIFTGGIFPITCGEVTLGWDQNDQVEEFEVTFAVNYWHGAGATR